VIVPKTFNWALLLLIAIVGCSESPNVDLSPIMAPVENRDREANTYAEWQPTREQLTSLRKTQDTCKGSLGKLLDHAKWSGNRLRVTGMRNGMAVTESIGPWHIILVPTSDASVVEIKGLLFAKGFSVELDLDRDILIVNDSEFQGHAASTNSPMFENAGLQGVYFDRGLGLVMGSASIGFLDDGRVVMDFHKVIVNGTKAGEYGVLHASEAED
jgi:hypothetical protein